MISDMPARIRSHEILCNNDGEWWVDSLENKVLIIGSSTQLQLFIEFFISFERLQDDTRIRASLLFDRVYPVPNDFFGLDRRIWQNDHWGCDNEPWNVEIEAAIDPWSLSFSFDTGGGFPKPVFDRLAKCFPRLAFYCFPLECNEQYLEHGWFNTPADRFDFQEIDLYEGAASYNRGGIIQDTISELRHQAAIEHLKQAARRFR